MSSLLWLGIWPRGLALLVAADVLGWWLPRASAAKVLIVNQGTDPVEVVNPRVRTLQPGKSWTAKFTGLLQLSSPVFSANIEESRYEVVIVNSSGAFAYDTNDLQMELSLASHQCLPEREVSVDSWKECTAKGAFGGIPAKVATEAFGALWDNFEYWSLCEVTAPAPGLRTLALASGQEVVVLREKPMIAVVRGFFGSEECAELMETAGFDRLVRAHTGTGGGKTSISESRETLTMNLFVDWDSQNPLSSASVRMFDLVSELLGEQVPYEGQEPVNFLHYLHGFEYKPHSDGRGQSLGKRVATTLVYCQAAESGGATVFPPDRLKFAPGPGDLLFFQYLPDPNKALHAACPVGAGNKSTLTQWHRMGVSPEKPWYLFEDWGTFHNPHAQTRWKGPRYGVPPSHDPKVEF